MARGKQLQQLVYALRAECGHELNAAAGVDGLPAFKHILARTQEQLADTYDWPFLKVRKSITLAAGQRYYDFPAGMPVESIKRAEIFYNSKTYQLDRGIGLEHYAVYDPEANVRSTPAMAWDIWWTGTKEQVEIWPLPSTNGEKVYLTGHRPLRALVSDSDVADLDDILITLFCAAEVLARQKSADAAGKLKMAQERLTTLKGRTKGASKPIDMLPPKAMRGGPILRVPRSE